MPIGVTITDDDGGATSGNTTALVSNAAPSVSLEPVARIDEGGIALLHGWSPMAQLALSDVPHREPDEFRRLTIDLFVPPGGSGYWEGAVREPDDPVRTGLTRVLAEREPFTIDILYGDQDGGQRTVSRFHVLPGGDGWYCLASRHWNIDRPGPR